MTIGTLVLVRHGQSEWNLLNLFTGWKNPSLTEKGREEALTGAKALKKNGYDHYDIAFTSDLSRAQQTLEIILKEIGQTGLETVKDVALNERDYGDLVGMNKDDARKKFGEEQVHQWRRSYDIPPPGGESLEMTAARTLPYFKEKILPQVMEGKNVLIAAHGNSLRSIIMDLDNLSREEVLKLELATGVPIVFKLNEEGKTLEKTILTP